MMERHRAMTESQNQQREQWVLRQEVEAGSGSAQPSVRTTALAARKSSAALAVEAARTSWAVEGALRALVPGETLAVVAALQPQRPWMALQHSCASFAPSHAPPA